MSVRISQVAAGSPADKQGIRPEDRLLSINGHPIVDVLDYRFYMTDSRLDLALLRPDGSSFACVVRKGEYEDLGLEFDTFLIDEQRRCKNKCVFCFIDQLPSGMRDTLYFKDDDSRLSFLWGNYITLTNLQDGDIQRIIDMRISPINISVHTTDPELRVAMMANPRSGQVLDYLPQLIDAGISVNSQLVLCPGINDGPHLERSLADLCRLTPGMQSIAVVPVGLTRFRDKLAPLRLFTQEECRQVIETVEHFGQQMLQKHGMRICYASDEFYIGAALPLPSADHYEDFCQLENGVGMVALLLDEFEAALQSQPATSCQRRVTIATGVLAAPYLQQMAQAAAQRFCGLEIRVLPIVNDFFGHTITVAGLITGGDLAAQLSGQALGDQLLIPRDMLRHEGDLFLDGVSLQQLEDQLAISIAPVPNDGDALLHALLGRPLP